MGSLLKVNNISKRFKQKQVVDSLSLQLQQGEVVGMLGPNGAGKTTAFYLITGLLKLDNRDNGSIEIDQTDISRFPMHKRAKSGIGYLPQEPSIFQKLTVEENIRVALEASSDLDQTEMEDKLQRVLDDLQLNEVRDQIGLSLSGGERRRTEIARLISTEPTFLLLDEPFAGIDPLSISELQNLVGKFKKQNFGLLISDHNVKATLHICDRAYIVYQGRVLMHGTPQQLLEDERVRDIYLGTQFQL